MRRRRFMDYMMLRDGRNPYGSEGGYVVSSRRGRRDRAYEDMRGGYRGDRGDYRGGDFEYGSRRGDRAYSEQDMERGRRDYESGGQYDMARMDYGDMRGRGRDGHYPMVQGYMPIEAMGRFNGYWGVPEEDYGRYDMRGRGRDYGYDMRYDMAGDYGERLTKEELEEWKHKLLKEVPEAEKQFFTKEQIAPKAKQMGLEMKDYNEEELVVATAMVYSDYCKTAKKYIGNNMNFFIEIARDWLEDKDAEVMGGQKLAIYYDCIVLGEDD